MQLENAYPDIWSRILSHLRLRVDTRSFDTWLQPTHQASWAPPDLTIEVPNQAFVTWIQAHFLGEVRSILDEIGHPGARVSFEAQLVANSRSSFCAILDSQHVQRISPYVPAPCVQIASLRVYPLTTTG